MYPGNGQKTEKTKRIHVKLCAVKDYDDDRKGNDAMRGWSMYFSNYYKTTAVITANVRQSE